MKKILLLLLLCITLSGFASAAALTEVTDLNIDSPANTGNYISPSAKSFSVVWWYQDANYVPATHDVNLYINIANTVGDVNESLLSDANADTYCNVLTSDIDYTNATKCSYTWSTAPSSSDGNYTVDINMMNSVSSTDNNSVRLRSSVEFVLDQTAPAPMNGVSVTPLDGGSFDLYWDQNTSLAGQPTDFNSYFYWQSATEFTDCSSATLTAVSTTGNDITYQFTGLTTRTLYWFCVSSDDLAGNTTTTSTVTIPAAQSQAKGGTVYIPPSGTPPQGTTQTGPQFAGDFFAKEYGKFGNITVTGGVIAIFVVAAYLLLGKKTKKK